MNLYLYTVFPNGSGITRTFAWGIPNQSMYMRTGKIHLGIRYNFIKSTQQFGAQLLNSIINLKLQSK